MRHAGACARRSRKACVSSSGIRSCGRCSCSSPSSNFFSILIYSIFIVFAVRTLHLSAATIGLILSLATVGTLGGALMATRIARRFGIGPTIVSLAALSGIGFLFFPLARGSYAIPFIVAGQLLYNFSAMGMNINGISLVQAITPDRMLGRTNASRRFVVWGVMPFGGLIGGALGSALGLRAALWIGAIGCSLAFVALLPSPLRRIRVVEDAEALT